jgi:riboflavin synthase
MFTGIVTELGKVISTRNTADGKQLHISANAILNDLQVGDSVSVNGVCQTVISFDNTNFCIDAVGETLKKTTLNELQQGSIVNLEAALTLQTRIGGHFVQGHIDTVGSIIQIDKRYQATEYYVSFSSEFRKYLARTGSIAMDGISLTTAEIFDASFKLAIIPHTIDSTIIKHYKVGTRVNLEFDILGKYIESQMRFANPNSLQQFINQPI